MGKGVVRSGGEVVEGVAKEVVEKRDVAGRVVMKERGKGWEEVW